MIKIERKDEVVVIKLPYNLDYISKIKTIKGYKWHPEGKYRSILHSELQRLLSMFDGEKVDTDPFLDLEDLRKELACRGYSL